MTTFLAGLAIFLGMHSAQALYPGGREAVIARIGALGWKGLYSVVSLAGFWLLVQGYGEARPAAELLWTPPSGLMHVSALLNLVAFVFLAASGIPGNAIRARVGHPMTIGVKVWALAHLLANGDSVSMLLFAAILVWAVLVFRAARRRQPASGAAAATSRVATLATVLVGVGAGIWFAFVGHAMLIGVAPFGS
ncbi:MAG: protein NrnU [Betaproteobacteria bacterium]|nr:protein NrnU [Betaproteobacteria bacterium]